jgi:hypothetical protein
MALPNPRVLPAELSFWSTSFNIEWAVTTPFRARAGGVAVVETGGHAWRATFMSPPRYKKDDLLLIKAWFNSMRGGTFNFLAHDAARPYPRNYPSGFGGMTRAGGSAFDGTATVTAVTTSTIALSTLPANFVLKPADYISLIKSGKYSLHQIMEAVTGNGAGVATVTVEPPIVTSVFAPPSLTANLALPLGLFVPDPRSWQGDPTARRAACSFSAWSRIT